MASTPEEIVFMDDLIEFSDYEEELDSSDNESVSSSTSSTTSDLTTDKQEKKPKQRSRRTKKKSSISVWVGNLPPGCTPADISAHFAAYKSDLIRRPLVKEPKASKYLFAILAFSSLEKANEAIQQMNGSILKKRKLTVKLSERKKKDSTTTSEKQSGRSSLPDTQTKKPQTGTSQTKKPQIGTSQTKKPQTGTSQTRNPQTGTSQTRNSQTGTSQTVQVSNIPIGMDNDDLRGLVAECGAATSCNIFFDQRIALVSFSSVDAACKAVSLLNGKNFSGIILSASFHETKGHQFMHSTSERKQEYSGHTTPKKPFPSRPNPPLLGDSPHVRYPGPSHPIHNPHLHDPTILNPLYPGMNRSPVDLPPPLQFPSNVPPNFGQPLQMGRGYQQFAPFPPGGSWMPPFPPGGSSMPPFPPGGSSMSPFPPGGSSMPPFPPGGRPMSPPFKPSAPFPPGGRPMSPPFKQSAPFPPGGMIGKPVYTGNDHPPVHSQEKPNASLKSQCRRRTSAQEKGSTFLEKEVSREFYDMLCKNASTQIEVLKQTKGSLDYDGRMLKIKAPSTQELTAFEATLNSYSEKVFTCSPSQWNQLVMVNQHGHREMDDLITPFKYNPNVFIHEKPPMNLVFVGTIEAVNGAFDYISSSLNKELSIDDSSLVSVLVELHPDLPQQISAKHGVTLVGYTVNSTKLSFEGPSQAINEARSLVQAKIRSVCPISLPTLPPPLLRSAKKMCTSADISVVIFEKKKEVEVYCSDSDLQRVEDIFRKKPFKNEINLKTLSNIPSENELYELAGCDSVYIQLDEEKIVLQGFSKEEVQAVKKTLLNLLKKMKSEETLSCTKEQKAFLLRLLEDENPTGDSLDLLNSLPIKPTVQKRDILISGTKEQREQTAKSLIDYVPHFTSSHSLKLTNHRYLIPLIEAHVLRKMWCVDYIVQTESVARGRDKSIVVVIMLYSRNKIDLDNTKTSLEEIEPSTLYFSVNPKAKDLIGKQKGDIEKQYRCCIELGKDTVRIAVHGLTQEERDYAKMAIKDYIEEHYIVYKEIPASPIPALQMKFILTKHDEELKKLGKPLQMFYVPQYLVKKNAFDVAEESPVIKVKGSVKQLIALEEMMEELTQGDFTVQSFELSCNPLHRSLWIKRWAALKHEAEETQDVFVEFKLPKFQHPSSPQATAGSASRDLSVSFLLYGYNSEYIHQMQEVLFLEVDQPLIERKLKLSTEDVDQVQVAITNKRLDFSNYVVQVNCANKKGLIYIKSPQCSAETPPIVEEEITGFLNHSSVSSNDILSPNVVVHLVLTSSKTFPYFNKLLSVAQSNKVSMHSFRRGNKCGISLKGSKISIDTVKPHIEGVFSEIQMLMGNRNTSVDSLLLPVIKPHFQRDLCSKLENDFFVTITRVPQKQEPNEVITEMLVQPSVTSLAIKLSLHKGSLVNESTDALVNAASEDLQHIGGVAKSILNAGGPVIQQQSNQYLLTHGRLKPGDAICLSAGELPCRKVIHAVPPRWKDGGNQEELILYLAVMNSLKAAENYNLSSIAFPALGCALFRVPEDICAKVSLKAVRDYCQSSPQSSLKHVVFALFVSSSQQVFKETVSEVFPIECVQSIPTSLSQSSVMMWYWENDQHTFSPYNSDIGGALTLTYRKNPQDRFYININNNKYIVDFKSMIQTNEKTKYQRKIKVEETVQGKQDTWYWTDDRGQFSPYTAEQSIAIDNIYKSRNPRVLVMQGNMYSFDFSKMTQTNVATGHTRAIKRMASSSPLPVHSAQVPKPLDPVCPSPMYITLYGLRENLESAEKIIQEKLKRLMKTEQLEFPFGREKFEKKLRNIAAKYKVSYEFNETKQHGGSKQAVVLKGIKVDLAIKELQHFIIEQQATENPNTEVPSEWQPQSNTTELFHVPRGCSEWLRVEQQFQITMPSVYIQEMLRIQNIWLWERYVQEKNGIKKFKGMANEKELFHGTRSHDPNLIYDSEVGFDMRFSAQGMWGQANYFAVNAKYSHSYAHTNALGQREIFLAKVITGDSYECPSDRSLRMPPLKQGGSGQLMLSQVRYDTVTGTTGGSQVYMTYDNQKAYPAYLIRY